MNPLLLVDVTCNSEMDNEAIVSSFYVGAGVHFPWQFREDAPVAIESMCSMREHKRRKFVIVALFNDRGTREQSRSSSFSPSFMIESDLMGWRMETLCRASPTWRHANTNDGFTSLVRRNPLRLPARAACV